MATHVPEVDWTQATTVNSYVVYKTATTPAISTISGSGTSDTLASRAISTTGFNGKKIMVGVEIIAGFADVASSCTVQLSTDGSAWTEAFATVSADITPDVTDGSTLKLGVVDFTNCEVPFFRIVANENAQAWGNTGTLKFVYCLPPAS